jgi:hypothetical protein
MPAASVLCFAILTIAMQGAEDSLFADLDAALRGGPSEKRGAILRRTTDLF